MRPLSIRHSPQFVSVYYIFHRLMGRHMYFLSFHISQFSRKNIFDELVRWKWGSLNPIWQMLLCWRIIMQKIFIRKCAIAVLKSCFLWNERRIFEGFGLQMKNEQWYYWSGRTIKESARAAACVANSCTCCTDKLQKILNFIGFFKLPQVQRSRKKTRNCKKI